jgi:hypothetical protein
MTPRAVARFLEFAPGMLLISAAAPAKKFAHPFHDTSVF